MTRYVALLRAVNVGGTSKLAMTELIPVARMGTARNMNTVAKLAEIASKR